MNRCFVIQPFDGGAFDKRYDDVIAPAIKDAGLEAYRVDRDPAVTIPIDQIEQGIRDSAICLADISTNNPNVWFELGYALATGKEVVLVCAHNPEHKFPFDIQHRTIIQYKRESPSDFTEMQSKISERLKAVMKKEGTIEKLARLAPIVDVAGLAQHEMVLLVTIAANIDAPDESTSLHSIRQDMDKAGYTRIAVTLGLAALLEKKMLTCSKETNQNGEPYITYGLTPMGMNWLLQNQDKFALKAQPKRPKRDDEVPF